MVIQFNFPCFDHACFYSKIKQAKTHSFTFQVFQVKKSTCGYFLPLHANKDVLERKKKLFQIHF